jgi:hypothetical protein
VALGAARVVAPDARVVQNAALGRARRAQALPPVRTARRCAGGVRAQAGAAVVGAPAPRPPTVPILRPWAEVGEGAAGAAPVPVAAAVRTWTRGPAGAATCFLRLTTPRAAGYRRPATGERRPFRAELRPHARYWVRSRRRSTPYHQQMLYIVTTDQNEAPALSTVAASMTARRG